jgi:hypothetical protein
MGRHDSELFGRFIYDDSLTYEAMMASEGVLIAQLNDLLPKAGAAHLDFDQAGDALRFQCAFDRHRLFVFRKLAQEMAALLPEGIKGRFLCLDKGLDTIHVYYVETGRWQEEALPLPQTPPEGLKVHHVPSCHTGLGQGERILGACG